MLVSVGGRDRDLRLKRRCNPTANTIPALSRWESNATRNPTDRAHQLDSDSRYVVFLLFAGPPVTRRREKTKNCSLRLETILIPTSVLVETYLILFVSMMWTSMLCTLFCVRILCLPVPRGREDQFSLS